MRLCVEGCCSDHSRRLAMQGALKGNMQAVRAIARSVTLHSNGAGVDNSTVLVSPLGLSR